MADRYVRPLSAVVFSGRATEDEMVGWHHQLNGHVFEQAPGDGEGQGSLVSCSPWGHRVGHDLATEQLAYGSNRSNQCLYLIFYLTSVPTTLGIS